MRRLSALFLALTLVFQLAPAVQARCMGENILSSLAPEKLAVITEAANAVPYARGNFWRATRGDEEIIIAGTYHLDDPRHAGNLQALTPFIVKAKTVLVEAGPDESAALKARIAADPTILMNQTGTPLNVELPPETWEKLSKAMQDRGIPAFMAAKFKPWYVIAVLSVPACLMADLQGEPRGLDTMVIETAQAAGIPVRGLEAFDTVFRIFESFSDEEIVSMLTSALSLEDQSDDQAVTLADAYFSGESRLIWELTRQLNYDLPGTTREQVDAEFQSMEDLLMSQRNEGWIPVLTRAAGEGPVFAAFGALHLSGEKGVLNLLAQEGFTIEELNP